MAFEKTWLVLIAGCGVLGLAIWGGMNTLTLKTTLLWMFISFGFLTLIMHLFGSPISVLVGKVFHTSADDGKSRRVKYSDAEVEEKRQRVLQMKQFLQDNKVEIYKENILAPREEMLKEKREAEFYKFNGTWRGKGQRLRENGEEEAEHNFLSEELLMQEETSSDEETDTKEHPRDDKTANDVETMDDKEAASTQVQNVTVSVRQRRNRHICELPEEPDVREKGVITVALRCPDGTIKKRRVTVDSQIKILFAFAECLGYSPSRHVILTTFPRQQLSDVTQTFSEAGLTHDTALVLEEI